MQKQFTRMEMLKQRWDILSAQFKLRDLHLIQVLNFYFFLFQYPQNVEERLLHAVEKLEKKVEMLEKERENQQQQKIFKLEQ